MAQPAQARATRTRAGLLALSGAAALCLEVVWLRRLSLGLGSTGEALSLTLSLYMAGLGLGAWLAGRVAWRRGLWAYGVLELVAGAWALCFPWLLAVLGPFFHAPGLGLGAMASAMLLLPPAILHGATLPAICAALPGGRQVALLYASNTAGAVLGVLAAPYILLPSLGVRGTECTAAGLGIVAGLMALALARRTPQGRLLPVQAVGPSAPRPTMIMLRVAAAGAAALMLEVAWSRLGALLLGGSVHAFALVLAVFLGGISLGAALGRRLGARALGPALAALGLLALLGTAAWRVLPHGLGVAVDWLGLGAIQPAGALLLALSMAGAPVASGVVFSSALAAHPGPPNRAAGQLLAANTLGAVLGAGLAGLVLMPILGLKGLVLLGAALCVLAAVLPGLGGLGRGGSAASVVALLALGALSPRWDPALWSVGFGLRVGEFGDLSPRAVERFAHQGFVLRSYVDGRSATVAVGESTRSGNRWLALNGKVDASTGDDMPTQQLSGALPVHIFQGLHQRPPEALVVGLASGVTAGEALFTGAQSVLVVELEPLVVPAAAHFDPHNRGVLQDPRATILVDDARALLTRDPRTWDIIISEPSNPWLTGVSNLFTREYWQLGRARLRPGGVFVQWVQLYALPPEALRSLIGTFVSVFGDAWLFETIPGADALLIAAPSLPPDLPIAPTLDPDQVRALSSGARPNTDDRPWVEFEAPKWLHRRTGTENAALIQSFASD